MTREQSILEQFTTKDFVSKENFFPHLRDLTAFLHKKAQGIPIDHIHAYSEKLSKYLVVRKLSLDSDSKKFKIFFGDRWALRMKEADLELYETIISGYIKSLCREEEGLDPYILLVRIKVDTSD